METNSMGAGSSLRSAIAGAKAKWQRGRSSPRSIVLLALAAGAVMGGVGCGSGSRPVATNRATSRPVTQPDKRAESDGQQALRAADAVCERENNKLVNSPAIGAKKAEIAGEVIANARIERATVAELRRLAFPASMKHVMKSIETSRELLASYLAALAGAMRQGHESQVAAISAKQAKVHSELFVLASRAGFKHCGST